MLIKPKKSLGQNFLIDKNIIKKILMLSKINNCSVIEIGPGTGNLTDQILSYNPSNLILIEKDTSLAKVLEKKYINDSRVKIFNKDILSLNIEKIIEKNTIIFGNLPYNISTQILIRFIRFKKWPPNYKKLIFMFQKEVAERIFAKSKTSQYGRLKIITNWRLKIIEKFNISKNCFFPKPKVDSTILSFSPKKNKYKIKKIENLEKITHAFFSKKRKMINKTFSKMFKNHLLIAKQLNLNLSLRPDQVSENDFYKITEKFELNN